MSDDESKAKLVDAIQAHVAGYFESIEIPEEVTVYDRLLLGLTERDAIATFNWDPLLVQARDRVAQEMERQGHDPSRLLPHMAFLHGNVAIGYCQTHLGKGRLGMNCPRCDTPVERSRLLYPVRSKGYTGDAVLRAEWDDVQTMLKQAYVVTIFGYSAPTADVEAKDLMMEAWGGKYARNMEEFELINIESEDDVRRNWDEFILEHHYHYTTNFHEPYAGRHPRRACESVFTRTQMVMWQEAHHLPTDASLADLVQWLKPHFDAELNRKPVPFPLPGWLHPE